MNEAEHRVRAEPGSIAVRGHGERVVSQLDAPLAAQQELEFKPVAAVFSWEDEWLVRTGEAGGAGFQAVAVRGLL
jgi:hypothetical protein